jgi:hypothetical protein
MRPSCTPQYASAMHAAGRRAVLLLVNRVTAYGVLGPGVSGNRSIQW